MCRYDKQAGCTAIYKSAGDHPKKDVMFLPNKYHDSYWFFYLGVFKEAQILFNDITSFLIVPKVLSNLNRTRHIQYLKKMKKMKKKNNKFLKRMLKP